LLSPDKVKEKALKALIARKLIEKGWLTVLLGYLAKKSELKVKLRYIGDLTLQRTDFGILLTHAYYTAKCWPELPEELARAAGGLLKPQDALSWLMRVLPLASYTCDKLRSLGKNVLIAVNTERATLKFNEGSVAFRPLSINFSIVETFLEGVYDIPEVLSGLKGREVVDVGANVGDTALYFILHGARKVIAVEPLPNAAKYIEENAKLNGVSDKVRVVSAALSSKPASVPCDYDILLSGGFSTLKGEGLCVVPSVTLGDLLNMVDDPYLLKMDCEGCEAEAILGPERERLRAFEHIIFETHPYITGVSNDKLLASLKELGFECRLHRVYEPKLGVNIYHCENSKPRQPNGAF
jgi:FkbM family methyltransferase